MPWLELLRVHLCLPTGTGRLSQSPAPCHEHSWCSLQTATPCLLSTPSLHGTGLHLFNKMLPQCNLLSFLLWERALEIGTVLKRLGGWEGGVGIQRLASEACLNYFTTTGLSQAPFPRLVSPPLALVSLPNISQKPSSGPLGSGGKPLFLLALCSS